MQLSSRLIHLQGTSKKYGEVAQQADLGVAVFPLLLFFLEFRRSRFKGR
ncbi:hypothetical protein [Baaleninema simplex]|nr:hypothetical protein [Baaleninema simplex]